MKNANKKLLVFASGEGTNFDTLAETFPVSAVITDNPKAGVIARAKKKNVICHVLPKVAGENKADYERRIIDVLEDCDFDLICLAGWMKILSPVFLRHFSESSILNIHPSALPDFPGAHGYEETFASQKTQAGITVHFVNEGVDTGPHVVQEFYPRLPEDSFETFKARGRALEGGLFVKAVKKVFENIYISRFEIASKEKHYTRVLWVKHKGPLAKLGLVVKECLSDSVTEVLRSTIATVGLYEKGFLPGVTDNPAHVAKEALQLFFGEHIIEVKSGELSNTPLTFNPLLEWMSVCPSKNPLWMQSDLTTSSAASSVETITLPETDEELIKLSEDSWWALNLAEMRAIKKYFTQKGRAPSDVEIEMLAQTWSEHCKHKIFRARIHYEGQEVRLFKSYIKDVTDLVKKKRGLNWLISVFDDNAGVVRFNPKWDVAIKVETHNSPSALDPYGGALTGVLGVNRDILGVGLGAKPVANFDALYFAPPHLETELPEWPSTLKHPTVIREGVFRGVQDAGNKSGIPNLGGCFYYHPQYAGKPLVYCGTVGIIPQKVAGRDASFKYHEAGDLIVMCGGRVGKDGLHGATFSSLELKEGIPASVVQIGDPFTQKKVLDFLLVARDKGLLTGVTDNGAGGLSSSVGEMCQKTGGAIVDLEKVPLKYPGMKPWEIWVSESQERMTLACRAEDRDQLMQLAQDYGVECSVIGEFTKTGKIEVRYQEKNVCELDLDFLHDGCPQLELKAVSFEKGRWNFWTDPSTKVSLPTFTAKNILPVLRSHSLHALFQSHENFVRGYDHEVQAHSVTKPFTSQGGATSGACLMIEGYGVAVGLGSAPLMSLIHPFEMGRWAVDEAVRNTLCAGGNPEEMCLVDNFSWPDPVESAQNPDGAWKLGLLVETCKGMAEMAIEYGMPFVSGKDSMKNDAFVELKKGRTKISALPTLLVTAMGNVPIVKKNKYLAGEKLCLISLPQNLIPLHSQELFQFAESSSLKSPTSRELMTLYKKLHVLWHHFSWCQDLAEGGLLMALVKSAPNIGLKVNLKVIGDWNNLLGEGLGRFLVSIGDESLLKDLPYVVIGQTDVAPGLVFLDAEEPLTLTPKMLTELRSLV
jgi:phosphoribosylformylglycinamidine synthase II/formyltetrahydrofolate-dependent phosphoribosylglycinamide formyltransferase